MNDQINKPPEEGMPPGEAPKVEVGKAGQDAVEQAAVEEKTEAAVPEGVEPEAVPPPAEVEKAAPPPGFRLIPEEAVSRLEEASAEFKGEPRVIQLVKEEPELQPLFEGLGRAIGGITVPRSDETEQKRAFGQAEPKEGEEAETPELASQEGQAMSLLLLGGVGAILLYSIYKKQQEQGAAA